MRAIARIRNYALLVFFIVLAGGALLQPGRVAARAAGEDGIPVATSDEGGVYRTS